MNLSKYYSLKVGPEFTRKIPSIRKEIGGTPFSLKSEGFGVGPNTYRALSGYSLPPSQVYRAWAESTCMSLNNVALKRFLRDKSSFGKWHASLADSLNSFWSEKQGCSLSFAHQQKLIDLFVKWLSQYTFSGEVTEGFIAFANCAVDSRILSTLNEGLSYALPITKPSMGDIRNEHTYLFCQELITEFATNFGGTPLLFDYFAWPRSNG
jgi:hypothetical protein